MPASNQKPGALGALIDFIIEFPAENNGDITMYVRNADRDVGYPGKCELPLPVPRGAIPAPAPAFRSASFLISFLSNQRPPQLPSQAWALDPRSLEGFQ